MPCSDSSSATIGAMRDFSWANGCEGGRTRRLSGRLYTGRPELCIYAVCGVGMRGDSGEDSLA